MCSFCCLPFVLCAFFVLDVQASALDPEGPVSITVDLGGERKLSAAEIQWEFPAKAFSITTSTDGVKWSEVYATDSNVLSSSSVALGSVAASKVRIVMHEARHTLARGRSVDIIYLLIHGLPPTKMSFTLVPAGVSSCLDHVFMCSALSLPVEVLNSNSRHVS